MFETTSNKRLAFGFVVFTLSVLALSIGLGLGLSERNKKSTVVIVRNTKPVVKNYDSYSQLFDPVALGYYPTAEQILQVSSVRGETCNLQQLQQQQQQQQHVISIMGQIQYIGPSSEIPILVVSPTDLENMDRRTVIFLHGYSQTSDVKFNWQSSQPVMVEGSTTIGKCSITTGSPFSTLPPNYGGGIRPRYTAIVFFYFQDQVRDEAFPQSLANLTDRLFNEKYHASSVNAIFKQFSGPQNNVTFTGLLDAVRPDIYGPVQIPFDSREEGCGYGGWTVSAVEESNIKTFLYDHIMFVGSPTAACPFLGTAVLSGPWSIILTENFATGSTGVQGHELGHCLGLHHAGSIQSCKSVSSSNIYNCSIDPYGDAFDLMSGSNNPFINSYGRESLGWLAKPIPSIATNYSSPQNVSLCHENGNEVVKVALPVPIEVKIELRIPANKSFPTDTSYTQRTHLLTHLYLELMNGNSETFIPAARLQGSKMVTARPFISLRLASNGKSMTGPSYRLEQDLIEAGDRFNGMGSGIKVLLSSIESKCLMIQIETGV